MNSTLTKYEYFKSVFIGRPDVIACYWVSGDGKKRGYSPLCRNEWKDGVCRKPCQSCLNADYLPLSDDLLMDHFQGNRILGIYPLLLDNTCHFIAADFDNHDGARNPLEDVRAFNETCQVQEIPCYVLRSKSGNGYHVYTFFDEPIPARTARAVYFVLLQEAQAVDDEIQISSFDRLFPNQDELTGKGLGNLIALPFQGEAAKRGHTLFLDPETGFTEPFKNHWETLLNIQRVSQSRLNDLIADWNISFNSSPSPDKKHGIPIDPGSVLAGVPEGDRDDTLFRYACRLRTKNMSREEAELLVREAARNCEPPFPESEALMKIESAWKYPPGEERTIIEPGDNGKSDLSHSALNANILNDGPSAWPSPMAEQAFHGVAGDFVRAVEPHTEADVAALLIQFLSFFGNVIGRSAYFLVEADKHYLNLFTTLVGETAKGRKGTSLGHVKSTFNEVDPEWKDSRMMSGLSSGEGLIWQVRDPIEKKEAIRERGKVTGYQEVITDHGEDDKRLMVIEPEFASTLRVIGRDGNNLSPMIRQAWDDGRLTTLTKNSPARATGAHISIIGHITKDELRRYLDRTETANGFANRFIWLCVKRSKALPEGGRIHEVNFQPILEKLSRAIEIAKSTTEIRKTDDAKKIWADVYEELSEGKLGLLGAVISRGEAQVMRLASIYAMLDQSSYIKEEHLHAALAIWDYSEASARYIFGDATGDPISDRILEAIREAPGGLTRTEINKIFSGNREKEKLQSALSLLETHGLIQKRMEETGGRPVEKWFKCNGTK